MQFPQRPQMIRQQGQQYPISQARNNNPASGASPARNPHYLLIFLIVIAVSLVFIVGYMKYSESKSLSGKNLGSAADSSPPSLPSDNSGKLDAISVKDSQGSSPPQLPAIS